MMHHVRRPKSCHFASVQISLLYGKSTLKFTYSVIFTLFGSYKKPLSTEAKC